MIYPFLFSFFHLKVTNFCFYQLMIYYRCHIAVVVIIIIVKVVIVIVIIKERFFCVKRVMKKTLVASDCISVQIVFFCYFQMSLSLSSFSIPFQIEESHSKVNSSIAGDLTYRLRSTIPVRLLFYFIKKNDLS